MVAVELDASVSAGALVCVIESMKMENDIRAHRAGTISGLPAVIGPSVAPGGTLASLTADRPV
jgi:acetyl-CoA/propionyl-CoA carboxylase, biotin carboxylase, biotin carboxyl carrier protein